MDSTFVVTNRIEGCLWIAMAIGITSACAAKGWWTQPRVVGVLLLVTFGISDFVETTTGAWWRPWWLFMWKASCVIGFAWWLWMERDRSKRNHPGDAPGVT